MDQFWDFIDDVRSRRWLAIALGAVAGALLVLWWVVVPRVQKAVTNYQEWQQAQERIASARDWRSQMTRLEAEQDRLRNQLDSLFVSLPRSDQMSVVLNVLQKHAESTGVSIQQVRPREKAVRETYQELPLDVTLQGQFHPVARFVDRLERSQYLMKVREVRLQSSSLTSDTLRAALRVNVVTLKEESDSTTARRAAEPAGRPQQQFAAGYRRN